MVDPKLIRDLILAILLGSIIGLLMVAFDDACGAVLTYTLPALNAQSDSSCTAAGDSLTDLYWLRLWGYPITGGGWRVYRDKTVIGREGQPDTLEVSPGWSYYVTTFDHSGNQSCPSAIVSVPGTATDVQPLVQDIFSRRDIFNASGQLVRAGLSAWARWDERNNAGVRVASGVYFDRRLWRSGIKIVQRHVIIR